jgi:hypothetical protein
MLPQLAQGQANKLWIVPSELTQALKGVGEALGGKIEPGGSVTWNESDQGPDSFGMPSPVLEDPAEALSRANAEVAGAVADAEGSARHIAQDAPPEPPPVPST